MQTSTAPPCRQHFLKTLSMARKIFAFYKCHEMRKTFKAFYGNASNATSSTFCWSSAAVLSVKKKTNVTSKPSILTNHCKDWALWPLCNARSPAILSVSKAVMIKQMCFRALNESENITTTDQDGLYRSGESSKGRSNNHRNMTKNIACSNWLKTRNRVYISVCHGNQIKAFQGDGRNMSSLACSNLWGL